MPRKGNCYDNCVIEIFFKTMKNEMFYGHEYEFKEIKAPTSYQLADKSKAYKVEADEETDTIIYYFENARIVVPNTGV